MHRARRARRRELSLHCRPGSAIRVGSRRNHEQRLQHERRGVRFTPGHGREPAGPLSCRTITQQSEREIQRLIRFDMPSSSARPPGPRKAHWGIVTPRRRSPGSGTASPRRIHEYLVIQCFLLKHGDPDIRRVDRPDREGRWSPRHEKLPRTADGASEGLRSAVEGCGSPGGTPARRRLPGSPPNLALAVLPPEGPAGASGDDVVPAEVHVSVKG